MDHLRISDSDRELAVAQLGEQFAEGRLTRAEFDERSDAVWSARTRGDLSPVFADLPVGPSGEHRASARPPGSGPTAWHSRGRPPALRPVLPRLVLPVLVVLGVITLVTHLPFLLLAVALWFLVGRRWVHGAAWSRRHPARSVSRTWGPGAGAVR